MTDRSGIICAGNWIVDLIHDLDRWPNESELVRIGTQARGVGGGPANVITTLAKLETGLPLYPMGCLLYTSPSPRDATLSRMPSSA